MFFNALTWKNYLIGGIALISLYYILHLRHLRRESAPRSRHYRGAATTDQPDPCHSTPHQADQKALSPAEAGRSPPPRGSGAV